MTCSEIQSRLSAYHDGELGAEERSAIADHLGRCSVCQAYLHGLGRLSELLQAGRCCETPAGLWARIAAVAPRRRETRLRRWFVRVSAVAAGFALFLAGHGALTTAASSGPRGPVARLSDVGQVLQEAGLALAGHGLAGDELATLSHRPELALLQEIEEEARP